MDNTEETNVNKKRGKWSEPGIPHKGWICNDIEDLGEPSAICEMCRSSQLRFAHHMSHPDYEDKLVVGCICAGHMSGDYEGVRKREAAMKSRADKRKRWLTRKWKISVKNNPCLVDGDFIITVFEKNNSWKFLLINKITQGRFFSRRSFNTQEKAKLAAFDRLTELLNQWH